MKRALLFFAIFILFGAVLGTIATSPISAACKSSYSYPNNTYVCTFPNNSIQYCEDFPDCQQAGGHSSATPIPTQPPIPTPTPNFLSPINCGPSIQGNCAYGGVACANCMQWCCDTAAQCDVQCRLPPNASCGDYNWGTGSCPAGKNVRCSNTTCCTSAEACNGIGQPVPNPSVTPPIFKMCKPLAEPAYTECCKCLGGCSGKDDVNDSAQGIWTGLGCIPTSSEQIVGALLTWAVGIGGGLALLLMVYGGFLVTSAAGNPEQTQKGKEVFGGAIAGLLFIIFSVVLLKIIGVDILQIPGL